MNTTKVSQRIVINNSPLNNFLCVFSCKYTMREEDPGSIRFNIPSLSDGEKGDKYGDGGKTNTYPFASALSMAGGDGENSYACNSLLQRKVIEKARSVRVKSTKEMLIGLDFPPCVKVADLGCSSGQNTFLVMSEIVNTVNALCQERGRDPPEVDCCLNDLPDNDFNTTFKFARFFRKTGSCFVSGVPGSFYSRLFPSKSLHFVHSSYSLHWLSEVPRGLESNKGSVFMTSYSPRTVYEAYLNQFRKDFSLFLRLRSEEMACDGRMVLTLIGRNARDPLYRDCCHFWTLLSKSLLDLVHEGIVREEEVDSFNMPFYDPDEGEVKEIIRNEGSFEIDELETHEYNLGDSRDEGDYMLGRYKSGEREANYIRAVSEPMLVAHFGPDITDTLFTKYAHHVSRHSDCLHKSTVNLVVSLIKK
ncbi:PREDICTED: salicylate/benzoate carboxyl methyltransferase-like [Tarenaya hassleriana]|uniref:salicylate/benzoate carboxyl methyltransferase-like n=1 Tax=Tarenaya hassleriana TaxID=28532 RepID=UPI00053C78F8|nr:PREDICTED: salicylate/benzoate carboxyl methyltransferase-like [Tarenaya hassleriana]